MYHTILANIQVILIEGWAFIWAQELNNRHLIKTKVIIVRPIDVTSHYGPPKWRAAQQVPYLT